MVAARTSTGARERILDAAEELFYARGIAATGVDAVLHRAGASPGSLYAHFGGKDGLVVAYLERRHHRWRAAWDEALAAVTDPRERLLSVFDALTDFRRRNGATRGCAVLAAAVELPEAGHPASAWVEADTRLLRGRLHDLAVELGAAQPGQLATQLLLVYDGVLAAWARGHVDPLPAAREAARALVDGAQWVADPSR